MNLTVAFCGPQVNHLMWWFTFFFGQYVVVHPRRTLLFYTAFEAMKENWGNPSKKDPLTICAQTHDTHKHNFRIFDNNKCIFRRFYSEIMVEYGLVVFFSKCLSFCIVYKKKDGIKSGHVDNLTLILNI